MKLHRFFVRGGKDKATVERRPMTPDELAAFDEVFDRMDDTFKAMDALFEKVRRS